MITYNRWTDVQPSDWFYQDVMELSNLRLPDGDFMIDGVPYLTFKPDAPRIQEVVYATVEGQTEFTLGTPYTPNPLNPLRVFFNGVEGVYDPNNTTGTTLRLLSGVPINTQVVALAVGIPDTNVDGQPVLSTTTKHYPHVQLGDGMRYSFDPYGGHQEYVFCFGTQLQRADLSKWAVYKDFGYIYTDVIDYWWPPGADRSIEANRRYINSWDDILDLMDLAIGSEKNKYVIAKFHIPGDPAVSNPPGDTNTNQLRAHIFTSYNFNDLPVQTSYWSHDQWGNWLKVVEGDGSTPLVVHSDNPTYVDRFFPQAIATRGETIALLDRLRKVLYGTFTDSSAPGTYVDNGLTQIGFDEYQYAYNGQKIIKTNGWFPIGWYQGSDGMLHEGLQVFVGTYQTKLIPGAPPVGTTPASNDYYQLDNHTIVLKTPLAGGTKVRLKFKSDLAISRFKDIKGPLTGVTVNGSTVQPVDASANSAWFASYVLSIEDETMDDGSPLIEGFAVESYIRDTVNNYNGDGYAPVVRAGDFVPYQTTEASAVQADTINREEVMFNGWAKLTRAECIALMNRFRKWSLERFM